MKKSTVLKKPTKEKLLNTIMAIQDQLRECQQWISKVRGFDRKPPATSEALTQVRSRFREAVAYAKKALTEPELIKLYSCFVSGKRTVYQVAISDFMQGPEIHDMSITYDATIRCQVFEITVTDNCWVESVFFEFRKLNGDLVDFGIADVDEAVNEKWSFKLPAKWAMQRMKLSVEAFDLAGNGVSTDFDVFRNLPEN